MLDWRTTDALLKRWGEWLERHASWTSYPSQSAIAGVVDDSGSFSWFRVRQFTAKGKSSLIFGGHKIICFDMPEDIRVINLCVNALPDAQYDAVLAWYGLVLNPDTGLLFTAVEKANALGVAVGAMEERLRRARKKLARGLGNATGSW